MAASPRSCLPKSPEPSLWEMLSPGEAGALGALGEHQPVKWAEGWE